MNMTCLNIERRYALTYTICNGFLEDKRKIDVPICERKTLIKKKKKKKCSIRRMICTFLHTHIDNKRIKYVINTIDLDCTVKVLNHEPNRRKSPNSIKSQLEFVFW